jgi:hypothetical protein
MLVYNRRLPAQAAALIDRSMEMPGFATADELSATRARAPSCTTSTTRDGLVSSMTYGDDAGGTRRTHSDTVYDARRRPVALPPRATYDGCAAGPGAVTPRRSAAVWDAASNLIGQIVTATGRWPAATDRTVNIRRRAVPRRWRGVRPPSQGAR